VVLAAAVPIRAAVAVAAAAEEQLLQYKLARDHRLTLGKVALVVQVDPLQVSKI
jgi:hypothetical protein